MSEKLTKKSVAHNYAFLAIMLGSMILGSIVGAIFPQVKEGDEVVKAGATVLKPLGTLFINMMFCIVVPMVFSSIAGSIATMRSRPAGRQDHGHHHFDLRHHGCHCRYHHDRADEADSPGAGTLEQSGRGRGGRSHFHSGSDRQLLHRQRLFFPGSAAAPCCP